MIQDPEPRGWLSVVLETLQHEELTQLVVTMWANMVRKEEGDHRKHLREPSVHSCFVERFVSELESLTNRGEARNFQHGGRRVVFFIFYGSFGIDNSDLKRICRWSSGSADPGGWLQLRACLPTQVQGAESNRRY